MDPQEIIDSQEILDSQEIMDSEDIINSEDIMDSDILDPNECFITPSKNFGTHWTGFLRSKEFKNDKARHYNAKCTYCDQILEACKETMTNHIINICRKIPTEYRIIYSRTIQKKTEQVTEISTHKAVLVSDYFDKATMSSEKTADLHTLLLRALVYGNISFSFVENPFFILFLNNLRSSYNPLSRYTLSNSVIQTEYARILVEMVDRIEEMCDLTLSLDGWTDISNNSIYAFILHKFEDTNEIINIENFSSI